MYTLNASEKSLQWVRSYTDARVPQLTTIVPSPKVGLATTTCDMTGPYLSFDW